MKTSSRDRISVDLRGLKGALCERALAAGVTPSGFVREALIASLHVEPATTAPAFARSPARTAQHVRVSLRMTHEQAKQMFDAARAAGLRPGAFVAGLVSGIPILVEGSRSNHLAALTATQAELATLSRNLHHLACLLRQGAYRAADEYRPVLETLAHEVRSHLDASTRALSDLRPHKDARSA